MKQLIAVCGLLALLACSDLPAPEQAPAAATSLRDLEAGYALQIPSGWSVSVGYAGLRLLLQQDADPAVRIAVNWDQRTDGEPAKLSEYVAFRVPRMAHFGKQRELIAQQHEALNPGVMDAVRVEYQYQIGPGHAVRSRNWLMVSGGSQYLLSLSASPQQFEELEPIWRQVQAGFRLLP